MVHELKLYSKNFEMLKCGNKKREYRLYDDKRRLINVGDTIKFIRLPEKDEFLYVSVSNIEIFKDWYSCYAKYFDDDFKNRYENIQAVVDDTYNGGYYTKEDSMKYGCCCITLENVQKDYSKIKKENK